MGKDRHDGRCYHGQVLLRTAGTGIIDRVALARWGSLARCNIDGHKSLISSEKKQKQCWRRHGFRCESLPSISKYRQGKVTMVGAGGGGTVGEGAAQRASGQISLMEPWCIALHVGEERHKPMCIGSR